MNIRDIMTKAPAYCMPESKLEDVARLMVLKNCGAIPIVDNADSLKPIGIVTDRDITCRSLAMGKNPLDLSARDVMTREPLALSPETSVEKCCEVMESKAVRRMLVVDEAGKCVGIVAQADIARNAPPAETAHFIHEISASSSAVAAANLPV
jgi:CBS domain-containing protein